MTSRQYRIDSVANRLYDRGIDVTAVGFDAAVRDQEIALFGVRASGCIGRSDRQDRLFISAVRSRIQAIRLERASARHQARLNPVKGWTPLLIELERRVLAALQARHAAGLSNQVSAQYVADLLPGLVDEHQARWALENLLHRELVGHSEPHGSWWLTSAGLDYNLEVA